MKATPPHFYSRKYQTRDGRTRILYYVQFTDWKGTRRTFPAGDRLADARQLRERLLGLNLLRHDFDTNLADGLRYISLTRQHGIDPATTIGNRGSLNEMHVSTDLLSRGWYVFRSTGVNAPFDLVICKSGPLYRVEVKGASRGKNGAAQYNRPQENRYDVLALAFHDGSIEYVPDLSTIEESSSAHHHPVNLRGSN